MGLGFELAESMTGSFHRFDEPMKDYVVRVTLRLGVDGLRRFARERRIDAEGVIIAEGLAENGGAGRAIHGSIVWKLIDQNRVPYELTFEGDDAKCYHLRGQRDFFVYNAIGSLTTLAASLYDDAEREIGRAELQFEPKLELPALFKSFRPKLRLRAKRGTR
jgi:hypothetical protein